MDLQLKGKLALVTGSTLGIGFATAVALAKQHAVVIVNGRTEKGTSEAISRLKKAVPGAHVHGLAADLSKVEGVSTLLSKFPKVDILINNLGIFEPKEFVDIPDADWSRFFEVNVMSGVRLSRAYLPGMLSQNWGRIVFVSSESGVIPPSEMIHYGMTKTAQIAIGRGLAELTKGTNVTVNSVLPGPTASEGVSDFVQSMAQKNKMSVAEFEKDFFKTARPLSLIQRFLTVEEVANTIAFIASPLASGTNGAPIRVEGGCIKSLL